MRAMWMGDAPDGDVAPIRVPQPLTLALGLTAVATLVIGVIPQVVLRYGDLGSFTEALAPLTGRDRRARRAPARRRAHAVRGVHGSGAVRPGRGLLRHRRAGGPPGRPLPDLAGGRPAVRGGAGPRPRRLVGGAGPAVAVHGRRRRGRAGHPGPGRARRRAGRAAGRRAPLCHVRTLIRPACRARSTSPPIRRRIGGRARSRVWCWPTSCSTTCPSAWPCSTAAGRRRSSTWPRRPARRGPAPVHRAPAVPSSRRPARRPRPRPGRGGGLGESGGRARSAGAGSS